MFLHHMFPELWAGIDDRLAAVVIFERLEEQLEITVEVVGHRRLYPLYVNNRRQITGFQRHVFDKPVCLNQGIVVCFVKW